MTLLALDHKKYRHKQDLLHLKMQEWKNSTESFETCIFLENMLVQQEDHGLLSDSVPLIKDRAMSVKEVPVAMEVSMMDLIMLHWRRFLAEANAAGHSFFVVPCTFSIQSISSFFYFGTVVIFFASW
jgi:hypothetical protein